MKVEVSVISRYVNRRWVRMVQVADVSNPHRSGLAPVEDEHDDEQYEAAIAAAVEQLKGKRGAK